ncbi:hypothetical protein BH23ACT11_BH23ACT11_06570 [soil metagenome]
MDQEQSDRILILGSRPSTRTVTSFGWEEIPTHLNIADYDTIVFDLAPLIEDDTLAERVDKNSFPTPSQVMRLLKSPEGSLVVIGGSPETPLWGERHDYGSRSQTLDSMFPILPRFDTQESGEQIVNVVGEFDWYLDEVARWTWWADPESFVSGDDDLIFEYLVEAGPSAEALHPQVEPLATTRFDKCVAFALYYAAVSTSHTGTRFDPLTDMVASFGPMVWLPKTTELSPKETVELILVRTMGVGGVEQSPEWANRYRLPNEETAADRLESLQEEKRNLAERIEVAEKQLDHEKRFKKLLYKQGSALEIAVWEALEVLGATVIRPETDSNKEDGRLTALIAESAMLEIKGRGSSIKLQDIRQLHDWMENAYHEEQWEGKGILIANTHLSEDPADRQTPFPDNCIRAARRYGISLTNSQQLFDKIKAVQKGEVDQERFWKSIFETKGVWKSGR